MSAELFIEIGTEELPAGFLGKALADLETMFSKELESARLSFGEFRTFATPRRLAVAISDVDDHQERQEVTVTGPPVKAAFDPEGNPTKAAIGFARKNGIEVDQLQRIETEKGEYLYISQVLEGRPAAEVLPEMLPKIINSLPFKKSMRWKDLDVRFARPIHWIVALYGGEVVPFEFGNLKSGRTSRGHRFLAPEEFMVESLEHYLAETDKRYVIADVARRKAMIVDQVNRIVAGEKAELREDEELLDEVTNLVEYPVALIGSFEEKYLQLPRELLITSMREHQRYFSLVDAEGNLLPRFITVSNNKVEDPAVVVQGNERVIRPRLSDAMFFWEKDQQNSLESRLEILKSVVYQAKLGTSYEKVMRFRELAVDLSRRFEPTAEKLVDRAALLAKCDLETNMVYEFPELQGIMGREYALIEGEAPRVAQAVWEHYLPTGAGGELPSDDVGAFVSIADKIDTICGCFGVGLIPTGTADPYALRRNAIGILSIIIDRGYRLSMAELTDRSVELLRDKLTRPAEEVKADVVEFIRLRFFNMLTGQGYPQDVVDAAFGAGFDDAIDARERVKALSELKGRADFEALAVAFKRVVNIIKRGEPTAVDPSLFEEECERDLDEALQRVREEVEKQVAGGDYGAALHSIATLREPVDAFFDGVMVMTDDAKVKTNRLALLTGVAKLFENIADFSKIAE
ncbi:MAG: glycine--tRNA ligase subunit beta [Desulfuromonadales bacterium]